MISTCWEVVTRAAAPVAHHAVRVAHAARRVAGAVVRTPRHLVIRHAAAVRRMVVRVACQGGPLVVAATGVLVPQSTHPPPVPPTVLAVGGQQVADPAVTWAVLPAPFWIPPVPGDPGDPRVLPSVWSQPPWYVAEDTPAAPAPPRAADAPEPGTAALLLGGVAGWMAIRRARRRGTDP